MVLICVVRSHLLWGQNNRKFFWSILCLNSFWQGSSLKFIWKTPWKCCPYIFIWLSYCYISIFWAYRPTEDMFLLPDIDLTFSWHDLICSFLDLICFWLDLICFWQWCGSEGFSLPFRFRFHLRSSASLPLPLPRSYLRHIFDSFFCQYLCLGTFTSKTVYRSGISAQKRSNWYP